MNFKEITVEVRESVGILTLNAPETLNALTPGMVEEINEAIDYFAQNTRAMILSGAGRGFCSGASLNPSNPLTPMTADRDQRDIGLILENFLNPIMIKLKNLPIPWITAVRGSAAGFGASLALAGDMIIASENAAFIQIFSRIGLIPDGGATHILSRTIGRARTMELMLTGNRLSADKALNWGLINQVVSDDQLEAEAFKTALALANGPTVALSLIRKAVWAAVDANWESSLQTERELQKQAGQTADFDEGVAAFNEKRPATFSGQ
ncbi:1,2-epoxyphenylacetyl-CoA isomerase [Zhongshania aliphaticivorans]|uniref:1,2-epoxyphenylacetyl-CoA isomerase n=1 Tax=Zhongshania aliphaticivorans TaxID=1470434 RepID=A0A5S9NMZ6_9GAMM|nr:enoyl-CoA hydratase-related protein [Zhongshania aliphaticivorans]CAA0091434.1 1,2-epoxyphenylacetyl-CoA isomerase [Zhongshania aliphaticivorans]CAA0098814.1 1,2-epoxyphenylacetyl-CoA isomerase [Zhongshania aliphaticivorans]